jgi:hypothetical protein
MPAWTPGQRIVVRYKNDQTLLSERIVLVDLEPAAASRFLLALHPLGLVPDLKIINGSMSVVPREAIVSMRLMKRRRVVFGVNGSDVCIVEDSQPRPLSPGEFRDLVDVAMMLASLTGGTVVADPPPAFPPAGAPPGLEDIAWSGGLVAAALFGGAMAGLPVVAAAACPALGGAGDAAPGLSAVALALKELLREARASKERKEAEEEQALATKGGKQ